MTGNDGKEYLVEPKERKHKAHKEPWELTKEEYAKAIEWTPVKSLPKDATQCHSYPGKEEMYYSKSTGRHYTVFEGIIRQSRTTEEIGFEPFKQEIHINTKRQELINYLETELKNRRATLDTTPIPVDAKYIIAIDEAINFAQNNPVGILLLFKELNISIHYYHTDKGEIQNLVVAVFNKNNEELYSNRAYDINLTTEEILRIKDSCTKQLY